MSTMREEFEAAYLKQYKHMPMGWNSATQKYMYAHANGAWWAWQTATPKAYGDGFRAAQRLEFGE